MKCKQNKKLVIIIGGSLILGVILGYLLPIPLWLALLIPTIILVVVLIIQNKNENNS